MVYDSGCATSVAENDEMNTASPIPKPEMVSIPKRDLDALLAELEALRKLQQEMTNGNFAAMGCR